MNLQGIINEVADQADDLLAGCEKPAEARAPLMEHLQAEHPELGGAEAKAVVAGVLKILDAEGFFELSGGARAEGDAEGDEEE